MENQFQQWIATPRFTPHQTEQPAGQGHQGHHHQQGADGFSQGLEQGPPTPLQPATIRGLPAPQQQVQDQQGRQHQHQVLDQHLQALGPGGRQGYLLQKRLNGALQQGRQQHLPHKHEPPRNQQGDIHGGKQRTLERGRRRQLTAVEAPELAQQQKPSNDHQDHRQHADPQVLDLQMAALALGRAAAGRPPEPLAGQLLQHRLLAPRGQQLGAVAGRHGLAPQ